jgi:hypothetical protein
MASRERACGRAGCSLQGSWTDADVCPACGFPTRQGEEARYAAEKRQLLNTAQGGLEPGETPTSYGFMLRQAEAPSHPGCAKVEACNVVRSVGLLLRVAASGTLTCGTEGIAFWTDDGLSFRWPYEQVVSITLGSGATQTGGGFGGSGFGLGTVIGLHFGEFLNKVTTQMVAHALISVVMRESSVMFRTASVSQQKLELDLAPALRRVAPRS